MCYHTKKSMNGVLHVKQNLFLVCLNAINISYIFSVIYRMSHLRREGRLRENRILYIKGELCLWNELNLDFLTETPCILIHSWDLRINPNKTGLGLPISKINRCQVILTFSNIFEFARILLMLYIFVKF